MPYQLYINGEFRAGTSGQVLTIVNPATGAAVADSAYGDVADALAAMDAAAYVLTRDFSTAIRVSEALEYGVISLNDAVPTVPQAPFGGWKQSSINREGGYEGILSYMETKYISVGV